MDEFLKGAITVLASALSAAFAAYFGAVFGARGHGTGKYVFLSECMAVAPRRHGGVSGSRRGREALIVDVARVRCQTKFARNAMGIATEIAKHLLGSAERALGVDDPVLTVQGIEPTAKDLGVGQGSHAAPQGQLPGVVGFLHSGQEFATEQPA
jgi:hypothetical protein